MHPRGLSLPMEKTTGRWFHNYGPHNNLMDADTGN